MTNTAMLSERIRLSFKQTAGIPGAESRGVDGSIEQFVGSLGSGARGC